MKRENNYTESKFYKQNFQFFGYYDDDRIWHEASSGWRYGTQNYRRSRKKNKRFYLNLMRKINGEEQLNHKSRIRYLVSCLTEDDETNEEFFTEIFNWEKHSPADWDMVD